MVEQYADSIFGLIGLDATISVNEYKNQNGKSFFCATVDDQNDQMCIRDSCIGRRVAFIERVRCEAGHFTENIAGDFFADAVVHTTFDLTGTVFLVQAINKILPLFQMCIRDSPYTLCGISVRLQTLSPSERQVAHVLLTRPPLR